MKRRKYHPGNLIPMFRLASKLCKQMRATGFADNAGAIHSAERILNILGQYLVYPELSHINISATMTEPSSLLPREQRSTVVARF
jgi:hypothetical protein